MRTFFSASRIKPLATGVLLLTASSVIASAQHYTRTDLVSNGSGAAHTDANLVNGWGLARSSTSPWWVSDNGTGKSTLYDGTGTAQALVVTVPGQPTGAIFNGTTSFNLAAGKPALFMFASEDGTISGWNPGVDATNAKVIVSTPGAVNKGLAIAPINGTFQLYAANFGAGHIDVFDANFQPIAVSKKNKNKDKDDDGDGGFFGGMPRGLAPFNVLNIGDVLLVAFAKQDAAKHDEVDGPGLGLVGVFTPDGKLIRWFEHVNDLNAPWGMAMAPSDFGSFSHHLLVGQFGSGEILAFDVETGGFAGAMQDPSGNTLAIDGLWGISFGNDGKAGNATTLYYAGGPNSENNGVFGSLTAVSTDLFLGNGR